MPDPNHIRCPHCGQTYAATPEKRQQYTGRTMTCKKCQQPFVVPPLEAPAEAAEPVEYEEPVAAAPLPPTRTPPPAPAYAPPPAPPPAPAYAPPFTPSGAPVPYMNPDQGYAIPQAGNGMATASLILGLLGCVPLFGLLAVIFGIIGINRAGKPEVGGKGRGMAIAGLVLGALGLVVVPLMLSIVLPSLSRARETANRVKCGSNLRQIGQAMMLYANENNGRFPDSPEKLITDETLSASAFVCPSTSDTPGTAANLTAGGHDSYVYLGKGKNNAASSMSVLVYELPANHKSGSNFLFGDGHVSFVPGASAQSAVTQLQAGQNPPPALRGY